jgi:hypothetical protein
MPLLGSAALLLAFDIVPEAVAEHDDWHTHEHLPERLSIPGFLRGTRWIAVSGQPRYVVLYEVAGIGTLTSPPYLERLDNPTPWTARVMPCYRGMARGLCSVSASFGVGLGHVMHLARFAPQASAPESLHDGLLQALEPSLPLRPGLGSVHLLAAAAAAPMTHEQRIRGPDAGMHSALLVMGYAPDAVLECARTLLGTDVPGRTGPQVEAQGLYRLDYALTGTEVGNADSRSRC